MTYPYSPSEIEGIEYRGRDMEWLRQRTLDGSYALVLRYLRQQPELRLPELDKIEETYHLLCSYYARGAEDPSREDFLRQIGRQLMTILRRLWDERGLPDAYEIPRRLLAPPYRFTEDMERSMSRQEQGYYDRLDRLFDYLYTSDMLTEEEMEAIRRSTDRVERRVLLSALFVGAVDELDPGKVTLLIEAIEGGEEADLAIALPALLMIGRRHQTELVRLYPELCERGLAALRRHREELHQTVEEIFNAYSTERNDRIFTEEVMPRLQDLGEQLRGMPGATMADQVQNFYHSLDEQRDGEIDGLLSDAMERMGELRKERFDMEYSSAKNLKGFPFFREAAHWFYPYLPSHPELLEGNVRVLSQWGRALFGGRRLISSDRYSFSLIPGLDRMVPEMDIPGGVMPSYPEELTLREQLRDFIFGAYRFYHLYGEASSFINPFEGNPFVLDGPFTRAADLYTEVQLCNLALQVAHDGHYRSAGRLYERAQRDHGSHSGEVWRGIAVVCMMEDRDEEALTALQEAIREEGMRAGTAEKVASLLVKLGRKGEAITFIQEAEDQLGGSDAIHLVAQRMRLLEERGEVEGALQAAYKADYLANGDDIQISGELHRLLLRSGRAEEAVKRAHNVRLPLYEGLARLATGDRNGGIALLSRALREGETSLTALEEEMPLLARYDLPSWERALILDTILITSHEAE